MAHVPGQAVVMDVRDSAPIFIEIFVGVAGDFLERFVEVVIPDKRDRITICK